MCQNNEMKGIERFLWGSTMTADIPKGMLVAEEDERMQRLRVVTGVGEIFKVN